LTEKLAQRLYGAQAASVGQLIKLHGLQFTVIGTFKEKTESFGLSELGTETILIPIPVIRYFNQVEKIDPMYVQAKTAADVPVITGLVKQIIESRHREPVGDFGRGQENCFGFDFSFDSRFGDCFGDLGHRDYEYYARDGNRADS